VGSFDGDPDHPILPEPWRWDLLEFTYRRDPDDWRKSYIDLVFTRDGEKRRLRFFAPQDVELSRGMLSSDGLCIVDVSGRQLEGLQVRVASFEQSWRTPSFWAARVVDVVEESSAGLAEAHEPARE
jgi:hypothetical protein